MKSGREEAMELGDAPKSALDIGKEKTASELDSIARIVRQTGREFRAQHQNTMGLYADRLANRIERLMGYLNARDADELVTELEHFARRHPEWFLGGALALGLVTARFLKSSRRRQARAESSPPRRYIDMNQSRAWEGER